MNTAALSIRFRNLYGNIATGCCLIALGIAKASLPGSLAVTGCAVALLLFSGFNLRACLSKSREREDEMSRLNAGRAAASALWFTLIAIGVACAAGMVFDLSVDLASASCLVIGLAMVVYGTVFAWLERDE